MNRRGLSTLKRDEIERACKLKPLLPLEDVFETDDKSFGSGSHRPCAQYVSSYNKHLGVENISVTKHRLQNTINLQK